MKSIKFASLLILLVSASTLFGQRELNIQPSRPGEPITLTLHLIQGGIEVTGWDQDDIRITVSEPELVSVKKTNGRKLHKLSGASGGFSVEEENNEVKISVEPWTEIDFFRIQMPHNSVLNLQCINDGDISVTGIYGELDIKNINGGISIMGARESVVAHALNDDVNVAFDEVPDDAVISLTSLNGDIDLTIPDDVEADLQLKTDHGEILSDLEIEMNGSPVQIKEERHKGRYKLTYDTKMKGKINGGGDVDITMETLNGDLRISKK